jgi:uncharacterized protein YndB with AHSA1/START domain
MRYSDGPTAEVSVRIEAPAERVWALVTDIDLPARFSSEFQGAEWIDGDGPAAGARFVGRNRHDALGEWETTSTVTRYEPVRVFEWAVTDPESPSASWWFTLEPGDDGAVVLRQGTRMGPGRSGLNIAIDAMPDKEERIIARRLQEHERNMQATVEGVKRMAESADGAAGS